ncbi:multiple sugar-binding protein precursor [Ruminiclostridium hungatei]|uniref:Multiple sugar-binding protein n=1 Tax=Ruminiclostridium hungatei TaxID=48256 RepID=A0A1V4SM72_RUMHU|nr:extracellular solute-binding protein [Ruminiclostridium hungatei]OPX44979.1 multiple sugar-binding protein precursor [Ruminiclostridium hungatei]
MKKLINTLMIILLLASLIGCGKQAGTAPAGGNPSIEHKPVTLQIFQNLTLTDSEYVKLIEEPVKKKFPWITLIRTSASSSNLTLEDVIASGNVPDLIYGNITSYYAYEKLGLIYDLADFIKKYNFDINRIKPGILESIKNQSETGNIYTLPFNANIPILYYNKDIFDKFGVPYPSDEQITWEEAIELGKKLTRTDNGVNYVGLDVEDGPIRIYESLGLQLIDPETEKAAVVSNPGWKRVFDVVKSSFEVPGYIQGENYIYNIDNFLKTQNLAMRVAPLANMVGKLDDLLAAGKPINWGIAPPPTFKEAPGKGPEYSIHTWYITSQSKYKDEAFQVISYILSDEVQRILARNGRVPAIVNPELEKEYGADLPALQGLNVQNVFKAEPQPISKDHPYETEVAAFLKDAYKELAIGNVDVNTSLRNLEEKINKKIDQLKVAGK